MEFPTSEGTIWILTNEKLAEYVESFPAVDVRSELAAARQWVRDNPRRRKTHRGMSRFLNSWLSKCNDRGGLPSPIAAERNAVSHGGVGDAVAVLMAGTGRSWGTSQIRVWCQMLSDLPLDAVQHGIAQFLATDGEWPTIAKIRKAAMEYIRGRLLDPYEAFGRIVECVRKYGYMGSINAKADLDDLTWRAIKRIGGWRAICDSPSDRRESLRAQFRDAYQWAAQQETTDRTSLPVLSINTSPMRRIKDDSVESA